MAQSLAAHYGMLLGLDGSWEVADVNLELEAKEGRVTAYPDPLDALRLLDCMFAADNPRHVVLLRDLQLHLGLGASLVHVHSHRPETELRREGAHLGTLQTPAV